MKRLTFSITVLLLLGSNSSWSMGRPSPTRLVVALGDSMTAGTFANTTDSPGSREPDARGVFLLPPDPQKLNLDALPRGPDLKTALLKFLLRPFLENKGTLSWATGERIPSHFLRVKAALEGRGEDVSRLGALNISVPGSKSIQVLEQVRSLPRELARLGNPRIEYLAMTVGANDACISTAGPVVPDEEFEQNAREILSGLAAAAEQAGARPESPLRILVAGIPKIPDSGAVEFWKHEIWAGLTCETVRRKVFKFCPNLLDWTDEAGYRDRMAQVDRKNGILRRIVAESKDLFPGIDAVFGEGLAGIAFTPDDLALDCFHPNALAQQKMSGALWTDQPWF